MPKARCCWSAGAPGVRPCWSAGAPGYHPTNPLKHQTSICNHPTAPGYHPTNPLKHQTSICNHPTIFGYHPTNPLKHQTSICNHPTIFANICNSSNDIVKASKIFGFQNVGIIQAFGGVSNIVAGTSPTAQHRPLLTARGHYCALPSGGAFGFMLWKVGEATLCAAQRRPLLNVRGHYRALPSGGEGR